jgi:cell division protein FtsB
MGYLFIWFQGDDVEELEKQKAKRLEKIEKLTEEVNAIEQKITEIKSKG